MRILAPIAALILSASAALAEAPAQAVESLHAFNDRFNTLVETQDAAGLVDLYADDSLWIEQGKPVQNGREEAEKLFGFVTSQKGIVTHTVDNLFVSDDGSLAVMIGFVEAKVDAVGMDATGTYLFVLKPEGTDWKIATDMWHQHAEKQM